jgi:ketosteroid isomerase-like protein
MRFLFPVFLLVGAAVFLSAHHTPSHHCRGAQCADSCAGCADAAHCPGCAGTAYYAGSGTTYYAGPGATAGRLPDVAREWMNAYNSGDATRVGALYTDDAWYLSAHVEAHGRPAVQSYFDRGMRAGGHINHIRVLDEQYDARMAFVTATYEANNSGQLVNGRNVLVFRNVNGRWLIAAHTSVVAD